MTIDGTGNVGINTTEPQEKLHIHNGYIRMSQSNSVYVNINHSDIYKYGNSTLNIGTINNQTMIIKTNSSNRMVITGGGVGINNTSPRKDLMYQEI